jgi:serine/threonine protein kinase
VRRKDNGEIFAMKVLKKESIFARNDPKDLQHTIAERNVLALVNTAEHPFILGLKFAFHTPAKLYYVLNYCNGGDLYYLLSRCKRFKEGQVCMRARARACAREPRGERAEGRRLVLTGPGEFSAPPPPPH